MAGTLTLRVITPDHIALDAQVTSARLPGVDGSLGVLARHAHMVAAIEPGVLHYTEDGTEQVMFVSSGFAEVRDNTLRVVCEAGELPAEIDERRAKEAEQRARERLKTPVGPDVDVVRAQAALLRAMMRSEVLKLYGGRESRRSS